MTPRITLLIWSVFELALGAALFLLPSRMLDIIGITPPDETWPIRVIGLTVFVLGLYYFAGTVADTRSFYRWTVVGRMIIAGGLVAATVIDGPWQLWMFAVAETASALGTFAALRPTPDVVPPIEPAPAQEHADDE